MCFKIRLGANHETSRYFPDNKEKMNYKTTVKSLRPSDAYIRQ